MDGLISRVSLGFCCVAFPGTVVPRKWPGNDMHGCMTQLTHLCSCPSRITLSSMICSRYQENTAWVRSVISVQYCRPLREESSRKPGQRLDHAAKSSSQKLSTAFLELMNSLYFGIHSRELTFPTWGKGKSFSSIPWVGIC